MLKMILICVFHVNVILFFIRYLFFGGVIIGYDDLFFCGLFLWKISCIILLLMIETKMNRKYIKVNLISCIFYVCEH